MTRRDLLLGALALGGGVAGLGVLPSLLRTAVAAEGGPLENRHFIFCYFSGGWAILLGLDPRDPSVFREDNKKDTLIQPGYDLLGTNVGLIETAIPELTFGPYIGALADHVDRLAVVRGMSMDTLTHDSGRRRFITGKPPVGISARGSAISTVLSGQLGATSPIPNLSVLVESYNVDQPSYASALTVASVDDLLRALRKGSLGLSSFEQDQVDALLQSAMSCPRSANSVVRALSAEAAVSARELVNAGLDDLFDFLKETGEMQALRSQYGINDDLTAPEALAALAVTAITNGISRCVSIRVASGLDTHYDNWLDEQGPTQERGFNAVAAMMTDLASRQYKDTGDSWLDHTTIVGFSEFSRTALLNNNEGRDHSLTNACFLAGSGISGGRVIGQSSDVGMAPVPVNLETGSPDPDGEIIRPEHVHRALLAGLGVDEDIADLRVEPLNALLS